MCLTPESLFQWCLSTLLLCPGFWYSALYKLSKPLSSICFRVFAIVDAFGPPAFYLLPGASFGRHFLLNCYIHVNILEEQSGRFKKKKKLGECISPTDFWWSRGNFRCETAKIKTFFGLNNCESPACIMSIGMYGLPSVRGNFVAGRGRPNLWQTRTLKNWKSESSNNQRSSTGVRSVTWLVSARSLSLQPGL